MSLAFDRAQFQLLQSVRSECPRVNFGQTDMHTPAGANAHSLPWLAFSVGWVLFWILIIVALRVAPTSPGQGTRRAGTGGDK
jgi:hypothetical protein